MEICTACRLPVVKGAIAWHEVQTAKADHGAPVEWEAMPFHRWCWEMDWIQDEYDSAVAEAESARAAEYATMPYDGEGRR